MFTPLSGEVRLAQNVPAMQFGGGWISQPGDSPGWMPSTPRRMTQEMVYQAQVTPGPTPAVVPGPGGQPVATQGPAPALQPAPAPKPAPSKPVAAIAIFAVAGIAAALLS